MKFYTILYNVEKKTNRKDTLKNAIFLKFLHIFSYNNQLYCTFIVYDIHMHLRKIPNL